MAEDSMASCDRCGEVTGSWNWYENESLCDECFELISNGGE